MGDKDDLKRELDHLEEHLPEWGVRWLEKTRYPRAFWIRVPLAVLFLLAGVAGPLVPGLGIWLILPGLALLAIDVPFLRGPMVKLLSFINRKLGSETG
ncbi:MAG TPA: hypothetical protein VFA57_19620 [Pseudolabrys sp.]|nr:hypothetical protein [Pseudolabrys sp.]